MSVDIGAQLQSKETPIDAGYLAGLVQQNASAESSSSSNQWAQSIAEALSKKDSRYKFLVLVTEAQIPGDLDADLSLRSSVAAVWDSEKDGSLTVQIPGEPVRVLTVFWVYAN